MFLSCILNWWMLSRQTTAAEIAQLGERVTEDHKVPGSIPGFGTEHPAACPYFLLLLLLIHFIIIIDFWGNKENSGWGQQQHIFQYVHVNVFLTTKLVL